MFKSRLLKYAVVALLWCLLGVLATTMMYEMWKTSSKEAVSWTAIARRQFATYLIWGGLLTPAIFALCRRFPLDRANWRSTIFIHLAAALGAANLHALLRSLLDGWTYPALHRPFGYVLFRTYLLANGYNDLWMYAVFASLAMGLMYYEKYRDRDLRAALLETQLAQTELKMLKMQLHPHFLFNTLHAISTLMHRDVAAADRMIAQLSDLLRITLESSGLQEVTLKRELELLRGYLEIEKTRFGDRLAVSMEVDRDVLDARLPLMLTQPLVENAIRHGIARRAGSGRVDIAAHRTGDYLRIHVVNDVDSETPARPGMGIGVSNATERLRLLYDDNFMFRRGFRRDGRFEVEIKVPMAPAPATEREAAAVPLTVYEV